MGTMTLNAQLAEKFRTSLNNHVIFKNLYLDLNLHESDLVATNNTNVFVSRGNIIRYSDLNNGANTYHVIDQGSENVQINSIVVNSSGNYVAIAGTSKLGFSIIPSQFKAEIPSNHYVSVDTFDTIKKVLWHPAAASDDGLVVLTSSKIHYYNVSISTSKPRLTVDLDEYSNFEGKTASSISFGSSTVLSGCLTLYLTATDGSIFAIYPFLAPSATIKTTKSQIQHHFNEAIDIVKVANSDLVSSDGIKAAAIAHYEIAQILKAAEDKYTELDNSTVYINVDPKIVQVNPPELQGPLNVEDEQLKTNIADVLYVSSNDKVNVLATLSKDSTNTGYISYFIQDAPLIMKWKLELQKAIEPPKPEPAPIPSKTKQKRESYVKPRKGFGFLVNDSEDDEPNDSTLVKAETKPIVSQPYVFSSLKLAGMDKLFPLSKSSSLSVLDSVGSKLSVVSGNKILLSELASWTSELVLNKKSDVELIEYRIFDSPSENPAVAIISDTTWCSGDYLLALDPAKWSLSIFSLQEETSTEKPDNTADDTTEITPYLSHLSRIPLKELEAHIKQVKKLSHDNLEQSKIFYAKKDAGDIHTHLRDIKSSSEGSLVVIEQITQVILDFQQRIDLQYFDFQKQISTLSKVVAQQDDKIINSQEELINKITERQAKISERQSNLLNRLTDALRKLKVNLSVPLSSEEKRWFREINTLAAMVNEGESSSSDGLVHKIEEIKKQLLYYNESKELESSSDNFEAYDVQQLEKGVAKLKIWLLEESKLIKTATSKVDELSKTVST